MFKKIFSILLFACMIFAFASCGAVKADFVELHTWVFTSGIPNNCIKVNYKDENAVFECSVDGGVFREKYKGYFADGTVSSGTEFYWQADENGTQHAYAEIILKLEGKILGYAVIEISQTNVVEHTAKVIECVLFQGREVTQEQVRDLIEKAKR